MVVVAFPVSREVAFDYLVEPRHRAEWQRSLARVEEVDGVPRVGQTWIDVTRPGLRPRMRTTVLDRPRRWTEVGRWRGFGASLTLDLDATPTGCEVSATLSITARGILRPVSQVLAVLAPRTVGADLRRAARALSRRT